MTNDRIKQREASRRHYRRNKKACLDKVKRCKARTVAMLDALKAERGCVTCGEKHPGVLDFHHRDPATKSAEICAAARRGWSRDRLMQEVAKCDVLCANCHRKLHWEERQQAKNTAPC